eukprot:Rhum_TRINITY_DN25647_c0_g1::Rhum_TRINITY_DN25647_c0_g1_i1::g.182536::m.182536
MTPREVTGGVARLDMHTIHDAAKTALAEAGRAVVRVTAQADTDAAAAAASNGTSDYSPRTARPAASGEAAWTRRFSLRRDNVQPPGCPHAPDTTPFEENGHKQCPIPGLNNLLYSQVNRYFCAFRDRKKLLYLRDKTCMKYSTDWFRYSDILTLNTSKKRAVPICWGQEYNFDKSNHIARCEWKYIREWYGTPAFWEARAHIGFNPAYGEYVQAYLDAYAPKSATGAVAPYLSVHVRRGDYITHCVKLRKKKETPWSTYLSDGRKNTLSTRDMSPKGEAYRSGCLPSFEQIAEGIAKVARMHPAIRSVFVSTNDEDLVHYLQTNASVTVGLPVFQLHFPGVANVTTELNLRLLDLAIVDMLLLSRGAAYIFNRFSSFSGTPYELAHVEGRVTDTNLWWW